MAHKHIKQMVIAHPNLIGVQGGIIPLNRWLTLGDIPVLPIAALVKHGLRDFLQMQAGGAIALDTPAILSRLENGDVIGGLLARLAKREEVLAQAIQEGIIGAIGSAQPALIDKPPKSIGAVVALPVVQRPPAQLPPVVGV
jgi:hypothetical protein